MAQVDVTRWVIHPSGSYESETRKRKLREEKRRKLNEIKRASLVLNDSDFKNFEHWLVTSKGVGEYEQVFDFNFDAYTTRGKPAVDSSTSYSDNIFIDGDKNCKIDTKTISFLDRKYQSNNQTKIESEKQMHVITLKNEQLIEECKNIRERLLELIREGTGYIFVRGWTGYRVNTIILKCHCKQDKCHQILKPRCNVKKHHDPDNLKQFNCFSSFSVHFNVKLNTIKICFCHKSKHETLPITIIPASLRQYISTNLCFTARECFECLKRTPVYLEFTKSFDAKAIVRKIWKEISESQWNLDPDSKRSASKILKRFQNTGDVALLPVDNCSADLNISLQKAKPIAFIYERIISEIQHDVTEIVIDSTFCLSTDYKQYFVVVASFFGKGVPVGFMATETNNVDHLTILWFLRSVLQKLPKVKCINSDWSLAEIKAINLLKCSNQICLFHTLTAIRCKRLASKKNMTESLFHQQFQSLLNYEWVDDNIFDPTRYEEKYQEKVSEYQIREIVRLVRIAICDHILLHSAGLNKVFQDSDSENVKVLKLYEYHLKQLYVITVQKFSLPCYFCYLFNQYYNFTSFQIMSRVGKPTFFSVLRTSMMCESYFNQLKSWNLSGSRNYRFDTLIYILLNKEVAKIKESIRITKKFEKEYDSNCLVQNHRKHLPTWRKQWIIEWKNILQELNCLQEKDVFNECQQYGTNMTTWICGCNDAKVSPSSTCIHLVSLYKQKFPFYHGYTLQRFGKRNNGVPLVQHESLQSDTKIESTENMSFEISDLTINGVCNTTKQMSDANCRKLDYETEIDMISENKHSEIDDESEGKLRIFNFFLADEETRLLITQCPSFKSIIEEMTYIKQRTQSEPQWKAKTNKPEKGFKYDSWIRCLKYYQCYADVKANGNFPLPF